MAETFQIAENCVITETSSSTPSPSTLPRRAGEATFLLTQHRAIIVESCRAYL